MYADVLSSGPYDERKVFLLFSHLVDAVEYLHSKRIVHRDLKLENILVNEKWEIKLSDFGLSKILLEGEMFMKARCGTPNYVAPEGNILIKVIALFRNIYIYISIKI